MSDESEPAAIVWEGDSLEVLRTFPEAVMQNFGFELWQLQQVRGRRTTGRCRRLVPAFLNSGTRTREVGIVSSIFRESTTLIYVLHCFEKKSREMPGKDFQKSRQRLKAVKARLAEERKREKSR